MSTTGPDDKKPDNKPPTSARVAIWVIVGGIGLYLLVSGIFGILSRGA